MPRQSGFSMIELMIAMTVTLIVSAAIYGLLTSGGAAFRREPELAERQQNIRVAMDLITRDVFNAGAALPPFAQVFTRVDSTGGPCTGGLNGCGVEGVFALTGTVGSQAASTRAPGDSGDPFTATDVLELISADENCPVQNVCLNPGSVGDAGTYASQQAVPGCRALPGFVALVDNNFFSIQPAQAVAPGSASCPGATAGSNNGTVLLGASLQSEWSWTGSGGTGAETEVFLYGARVVRYRIGPSDVNPDPTQRLDDSPGLWRSVTGRFDSAGNAIAPEPGEDLFVGAPTWELVARGIEDLQVEYMAGDGLWRNQPPIVSGPLAPSPPLPIHWNTLVRQVRITVSARASAPNIGGATSPAEAGGAGPDAVRGVLQTVVAPRAALNELKMGMQIQ